VIAYQNPFAASDLVTLVQRLREAHERGDLSLTDQNLFADAADQIERLRDALLGVVGLVELVSLRDDLPCGLDDLMRLSHRMTDAYAALREGT